MRNVLFLKENILVNYIWIRKNA